MIFKVTSRSFKLEQTKQCYCVGFAEVLLFVISKIAPYSIQTTAYRSIEKKHKESL